MKIHHSDFFGSHFSRSCSVCAANSHRVEESCHCDAGYEMVGGSCLKGTPAVPEIVPKSGLDYFSKGFESIEQNVIYEN